VLDANYIPEINKKYKYIELSNIGASGEIPAVTLSLAVACQRGQEESFIREMLSFH